MNSAKPSFEGCIKPSPEHRSQLDSILSELSDNTFEDILPMKLNNCFTVEKLQWEDFVGEVPPSSYWLSHIYWGIQYSYHIVGEERKPIETIMQRSSSSRRNLRSQSPRQQLKLENSDKGSNCPRPPLKLPPLSNKVDIQTPSSKTASTSNQRNQSPSPQHQRQNAQLNSLPQNRREGSKNRSNSSQNLKNCGQYIQQNQQKQAYKTNIKLGIKSKCYLQKKSWVNPEYKSDELLDHERGHYLLGCLCAAEFKRQAEIADWEEGDNVDLKTQVSIMFGRIMKDFLAIEKNYDNETNHYLNREMQQQWNHIIKEQLKLYEAYFTN